MGRPGKGAAALNTGQLLIAVPGMLDPNFDAEIGPINPNLDPNDDSDQRWDGASVHQLSGTYGDYLLRKVAKVFPDLESQRD